MAKFTTAIIQDSVRLIYNKSNREQFLLSRSRSAVRELALGETGRERERERERGREKEGGREGGREGGGEEGEAVQEWNLCKSTRN